MSAPPAEPPWGVAPFWSRPHADAALVALAAAPVVAVLGYGWGLPFGTAWALVLVLCVRRALPTHPRPISASRLSLVLFLAGTALWFVRAFAGSVDDRGLGRTVLAPIAALLTLLWLHPATALIAAARDPTRPSWPRGTACAGHLRAVHIAWVGTAAAVFADEPLLPLCAAVTLVGVGLIVWITCGEARTAAWLTAVSKGLVPGWTLVPKDCHATLTRTADAHYRADAHDADVADIHAVRHGDRWSFARDPAHTAARQRLWVHGVLGLLCVGLAVATHSESNSSDRLFIVDRAPPDSVWARVPRRKSMHRMVGHGIPGVELWRDCKHPHCYGVVVPVDEDGRAIHAPAVMARVRDRPLREQVRVRRLLMAGGHAPHAEDIEALRCGDEVWARMPSLIQGTEIVGFNFATGATTRVSSMSAGHNMLATAPLRCGMASFDTP